MMRRLFSVAVLLAAVLVMGAEVAKAQETVTIALPSTVTLTDTTRFVVVTGVTDGTLVSATGCMQDEGFSEDPISTIVIVDDAPSPKATVVPNAVLQGTLLPGARLTNFSLVTFCSENGTNYKIYEGTIASPQSSEVALTITPAGVSLTEGHEAVVGAGTDELGIADVVCVKKGEQSIKTPIISDIPLEAGDRLTDFLEVDYDPVTGETTYACWLEY